VYEQQNRDRSHLILFTTIRRLACTTLTARMQDRHAASPQRRSLRDLHFHFTAL